MKDFGSYFKDKKVTVMRIGLIGRGIGDTRYMAEAGADITVVDAASEEVMRPAVEALSQYQNVRFHFGPYDFAHFEGADFVLVGAGAPLHESVLGMCRDRGVPLVQSGALFAALAQIPIIGVTGTRGKSTVTHMIHHALCQVIDSGLNHPEGIIGSKTQCGVLLGGNVRGVSNLELLKEVQEESLCVMELDSWQLQGFGWAQISPQIAVFTNFMEDHLNYYSAGGKSHEDAMGLYFADKANIFSNQGEGAVFITTPKVFERARAYMEGEGKIFEQEVVLVDESTLPEEFLVPVPGEHNRQNAALAFEALKAAGLTEDEALAGLATFRGVEGRLQYLGDIGGVRVFNDNNSTTPVATIVGMRAVGNPSKRTVVLIVGGDEKNLDMTEMVAEIPKWCSKVVMFKERGTDRIRDDIFSLSNNGVQVYEEEGLASTVRRAIEIAEPGEVLLYSPGFSSFGKYFKNEFDRGDQFVKIIRSYE